MMQFSIYNLLILAAISSTCTSSASLQTVAVKHKLKRYTNRLKRSPTDYARMTSSTNDIYSRSSLEIAESLYENLYKKIIQSGTSVDIVILLDGSAAMESSGFSTAEKFLARLISMMPREKFRDGSVKVAMLTYSLSENLTRMFDFSWSGGSYREMVRRAIKRTQFQNGYENHGSTALVWVEDTFTRSARYNKTDTSKIILYATNGHITDKDLMKDYNVADATAHVSHWLKNLGYKIFTIVPGTNVNRTTIGNIASEPNMDFIIPVVDTNSVETISSHVRDYIRGVRHIADS